MVRTEIGSHPANGIASHEAKLVAPHEILLRSKIRGLKQTKASLTRHAITCVCVPELVNAEEKTEPTEGLPDIRREELT